MAWRCSNCKMEATSVVRRFSSLGGSDERKVKQLARLGSHC